MRLATPLATLLLAAALLAGCGGSSSTSGGSVPTEATRGGAATGPAGASARSCESGAGDADDLLAAGVSCARARQVLYGWQRAGSCAPPAGASRSSCASGPYRCLGTRTDRGIAVSCSRPGESIGFVAEPR
jgi:hypothetical protein